MKKTLVTKELNIVAIKDEAKKIFRRKKNNVVSLRIKQEDEIIKIIINDKLIDEVASEKESDCDDLFDIVDGLVEQVKLENELRENKRFIKDKLMYFNRKFTPEEIDNNCPEDCKYCKYYNECEFREYMPF